jgi:aminoglycoside phosphotransferase (APT) family kinase protein
VSPPNGSRDTRRGVGRSTGGLPDRGGPLADHAEGFTRGLASATELSLIAAPDAVTAPEWAGPALWLHADLHPANVLTTNGTFSGVIDFGDLCAGDPAYDLAAAWILLPDGAADLFHESYRPAPLDR